MESRRYSYEKLLVNEGAEQSKSMEDLIISNQLRRSWAYRHRRAIALHLGLISFYTALSGTVFWLLRAQGVQCHRPSLIYSPADDAVEPIIKTFDVGPWVKSPYIGEPRPDLDEAWHDLLKNSNIRISAETLQMVNRTSIPLGIGGGYFGELTVFHELHCLKFIHHAFRPQAYQGYYGEEERSHLPQHVDHCIEVLRNGVMCRGDTTLLTFGFVPELRLPQADLTLGHKCINWDKLNDWAGKHAVNLFQEGMLVHPILGPSYPGGHREDRPLPPVT